MEKHSRDSSTDISSKHYRDSEMGPFLFACCTFLHYNKYIRDKIPTGTNIMNELELAKYKKEMRGYAQTYSMLFHASTREEFIKDNALTDKTLKGKWVSLHTTAIPVSLKREDGSKLRVLVVTKKNHSSTNCTGLLWLHGGGYAIGLPELDVPFAERFAAEDNCVMVLPDYTRSVDAPYPAALNDAYQTLLWMKDHAEALGIREDQLFVGGESAGGGLACALTLYARDQGKVKIAFQMPLYPMLDDRMTETSSHNTSPLWDTKKNLAAWKIYRGDKKETSPYFSPARETNYKDLPPAFSIISDNEPFYAETKTYFRNLYQAGISIMLKEYPGCFHSFDINCPNTKSAKDAAQLEQKVFRYAQKNYFASQPKEPGVIPIEEPSETEIQKMIEDIETQHEILAAQQEEPVEVKSDAIVPAAEPEPEETVPEVPPVEEEPQEVEPSAAEEETPSGPTPVQEESIPEVTPVIEEIKEIEPAPMEESSVETIPVEEPQAAEEIQKTEEPSVEVEERPVSEEAAVEFPVHPSEKKETISDAEIDQISSELTQITEEIPPEFEEVPEAEEIVEEISEELEEDTGPAKESFTREDVMNLLRKKDETRMTDDLKPYSNEKENILDNLQKIIEEDTTSSIEEINHLVDKL